MSLPKNFCIAPFFQHTTHPSGSCSPCPYLGGTTWPPGDASIRQQWNSEALQDLRSQFLHNHRPAICHRCWHEEDHGKRSLRLRLFDPENQTSDFDFATAESVQARLTDDAYLSGPRVLTIKNGNICNAKCRTCHPSDSSRWIADAEKLSQQLGPTYYRIDQVETNWSDQQIDEIVDMSQGLVRLELFGGEPTYNRQVSRLLQRLADQDLAGNITLYINTNGTVDIGEKLPAARHFQRIEIGVSIDGVGKQFNYIRHGCDYQEVLANIQRWKDYFAKYDVPCWIDAISTVNVFNIFYLNDIKSSVQDILPLPPFWNLLITPDHLFIRNMPDAVKQHVIDHLGTDPDYNELKQVMSQPGDPQAWQRFLALTSALDRIRGEDWQSTFPELAHLVKNTA